MYRIPQIPQPYKEDVELMKRGRKKKSTTTTRTKGVNIKNTFVFGSSVRQQNSDGNHNDA